MLSNFQKEALIGCCLGDISIQVISEKTKKARFQICQTIKHRLYIFHKYKLFENICPTEPKIKDKKYPVMYFNSISTKELYDLLIQFKGGGIRGVPNNIKDLVTPVSLAYWFCDDGTCSYNSSKNIKNKNTYMLLCTDRYRRQEVEQLKIMLEEKFCIKSTIRNSKSMGKRCRLYLGKKASQEFLDIVSPFVPQSMQYKVKRPYKIG